MIFHQSSLMAEYCKTQTKTTMSTKPLNPNANPFTFSRITPFPAQNQFMGFPYNNCMYRPTFTYKVTYFPARPCPVLLGPAMIDARSDGDRNRKEDQKRFTGSIGFRRGKVLVGSNHRPRSGGQGRWVPKNSSPESTDGKDGCAGGDQAVSCSVIPFPADLEELERSGKTTVMIKNIPNQFKYILSLSLYICICVCIYIYFAVSVKKYTIFLFSSVGEICLWY